LWGHNIVRLWFAKSPNAYEASAEDLSPRIDAARLRKIAARWSSFREQLVKRVRSINDTTAGEVREVAHFLNQVVESSRNYVQDSQRALSRLQGEGNDSIGVLLSKQTEFLRKHSAEMSERAAAQDERARNAAAAANSIADLAASIERLAGEARLLAVNARIESSRLGAHSAGFEVLASEMQRLSDEVASTNERVGELAERLGHDLPWIAQHARDFRRAMEDFSATATMQLDETERGVLELRTQVQKASRMGGAVIEDIIRNSQAALSHLQFQDVIAQDLRQLDAQARAAQVETLQTLEAETDLISQIRDADYQTEGSGLVGSPGVGTSGDVTLF
jgi:methyl-accepting chemotaxis protein